MSDRWLVVGLGNPGARYEGTRHNVGAEAVRVLTDRHAARLKRQRKVGGHVAEVTVDDARLVLLVGDTYMNLSGSPTQAAAAWYKVPRQRIIACHDDLDVALGAVKVKRGGGNAGHNGLRDLDRALGGVDYLRVRIGIGRPPEWMPGRDFVLGRFGADERSAADEGIEAAADAAVGLVVDGLEPTQNRFHARG